MMADEHRHVGRLRRGAETDSGIERVRHRLFDEHRHFRDDAFERLVDVHLVRRREDDAVRPVPGEQCVQRSVERHPERTRVIGGCRNRVDEGRQLALRIPHDHFDMPLADLAGAGNGDADCGRGHEGILGDAGLVDARRFRRRATIESCINFVHAMSLMCLIAITNNGCR